MTPPATYDPTLLIGLALFAVIVVALILWTISAGNVPFDNDH